MLPIDNNLTRDEANMTNTIRSFTNLPPKELFGCLMERNLSMALFLVMEHIMNMMVSLFGQEGEP